MKTYLLCFFLFLNFFIFSRQVTTDCKDSNVLSNIPCDELENACFSRCSDILKKQRNFLRYFPKRSKWCIIKNWNVRQFMQKINPLHYARECSIDGSVKFWLKTLQKDLPHPVYSVIKSDFFKANPNLIAIIRKCKKKIQKQSKSERIKSQQRLKLFMEHTNTVHGKNLKTTDDLLKHLLNFARYYILKQQKFKTCKCSLFKKYKQYKGAEYRLLRGCILKLRSKCPLVVKRTYCTFGGKKFNLKRTIQSRNTVFVCTTKGWKLNKHIKKCLYGRVYYSMGTYRVYSNLVYQCTTKGWRMKGKLSRMCSHKGRYYNVSSKIAISNKRYQCTQNGSWKLLSPPKKVGCYYGRIFYKLYRVRRSRHRTYKCTRKGWMVFKNLTRPTKRPTRRRPTTRRPTRRRPKTRRRPITRRRPTTRKPTRRPTRRRPTTRRPTTRRPTTRRPTTRRPTTRRPTTRRPITRRPTTRRPTTRRPITRRPITRRPTTRPTRSHTRSYTTRLTRSPTRRPTTRPTRRPTTRGPTRNPNLVVGRNTPPPAPVSSSKNDCQVGREKIREGKYYRGVSPYTLQCKKGVLVFFSSTKPLNDCEKRGFGQAIPPYLIKKSCRMQ